MHVNMYFLNHKKGLYVDIRAKTRNMQKAILEKPGISPCFRFSVRKPESTHQWQFLRMPVNIVLSRCRTAAVSAEGVPEKSIVTPVVDGGGNQRQRRKAKGAGKQRTTW
jgi:hypothetical protein